jgi:branched-chain amino acid transport system ATP-binding protein
MTALLELHGLFRSFGAVHAVDGVDLTVEEGDRRALIGPNGAGKSTLFSLVSGGLRPTRGTVVYEGRRIDGLPSHRRARLGIAQTFQHSSLFPTLTPLDNVLLARSRVEGRAARVVPMPEARGRRDAATFLDRVGLAARSTSTVAELSHGERRQLELAVALACEPRLLLLDEPAAGLSPAETARIVELLSELPATVTVLLIEHDLDVVFRFASTITVLHLGRILATGNPAVIRDDEAVRAAYLGTAHSDDLFISEGAG